MEGESAQRFAARLLERVRAEAPALDVALRWVEAEGAFRAETASAGMGLIRFADGKCDVRPEAEAWTRISILHVLREGGGAQDNAALALDRALAQRAIPAILASAPLGALTALPKALEEYPLSRALMEEPLPLPPL